MLTFLKLRFVSPTVFVILACILHCDPALSREQIDVTSNDFEILSCDGATDDAHKIQRLIDITAASAHTTFVIPFQKTCVFTGRIFLRSNVTFKFDDGAAFAGGSWVYVSRSQDSGEGPQNVSWLNCKFINKGRYVTRTHVLIRAANITFDRCSWVRVFRKDTHVIDIGGSRDVTINNNTFQGSYENINQAKDVTKEAIQVDYAWQLGMSIPDADLREAGTNLSVYNNAPSRNIVVRNSRFVPTYKADGTVESLPPPPFGVHAVTSECSADLSMCIGDVDFVHNFVSDVVDVGTKSKNQGILHFRLQGKINISGNTFQNLHTRNDYIFSVEVPHGRVETIQVDIKQNEFVGSGPRSAVIVVKEGGLRSESARLQHSIRLCNNKFYINDQKNRPKLLDSGEAYDENWPTGCVNWFPVVSKDQPMR